MTGRNYVVIFESNNENQIVAKVQSVKESPISLKTLHGSHKILNIERKLEF